jgi:ASC-1-like (ASCH) protein
MTHKLKIQPEYLANLMQGRKKVEIRNNDRDYQIDDILEFWHSGTDSGIGEFILYKITHIHSGLGMKENYVALSIERLER